jgi:hypothetical protein
MDFAQVSLTAVACQTSCGEQCSAVSRVPLRRFSRYFEQLSSTSDAWHACPGSKEPSRQPHAWTI